MSCYIWDKQWIIVWINFHWNDFYSITIYFLSNFSIRVSRLEQTNEWLAYGDNVTRTIVPVMFTSGKLQEETKSLKTQDFVNIITIVYSQSLV